MARRVAAGARARLRGQRRERVGRGRRRRRDAARLPGRDRRPACRAAPRVPAVTLGDLRIDPVERRVEREGRAIALLPREYALLLHLARSAGRSIAREELLAAVWGLRFDPGTNVVEVHVSRLRAKLDRGFAAPMLVTDKGRGYRLIARADPQP
ncbi:winged helix family transcriptional regulator [Sphingomonas naasensis]|uniref:Winged helix family transcriptional regulator n=1 Tax=Sphingomonas naasensis TaxID=1344951 RepID=A0A4S1W805_9SPHN|nr:winged helix family transcriptional regulator [Sphingomonas naasensis]